MNRQRFAQLRIAPLHLQQGLFASLALLVTLIAGQQYQRWQDSQAPAPRVPVHHFTQTHFSSVSSTLNDATPVQLMAVDQAQPALEAPRQQRWVF
ncbi:hypothetical protein DNK59_12335 [Pseudomonas sp. TKO26]|uniref:Uncharacterized protein n=1 Tax=Pseudomonas saponiphila TaxID=556534 RepID=A0A1H4V9H8_9PSED|nr:MULTISPECIES: hypothetical protein [Pseudomonas]PYY86281.1 hypothetical protein DNK62_12335 [Pseudomonas sp. TKO30]PYY89032.1 hypothetical protein DNK61_12330 [Pseudomonas sp. TKO29]PYY91705.1 hypothetical protein DNK59_12335 [Pseudomonas sp. TKO26]PYY99814.1 hypothetical protein DNK60_12330 [Pseudomonas sp. TKO14]SEC77593.1 hypothetical protein SAMN05216178_4824 [Pseudomonas saponiphila]